MRVEYNETGSLRANALIMMQWYSTKPSTTADIPKTVDSTGRRLQKGIQLITERREEFYVRDKEGKITDMEV